MSFRQFGGINYTAKNNIVSSNYNTSNNLLVSNNVGQSNSYINFLSDISGNIIGLTGLTGSGSSGTGPQGFQGPQGFTGPVGIEGLSQVLTNNNSAGSNDINMNNQNITSANQITCSTLNYTNLNPPITSSLSYSVSNTPTQTSYSFANVVTYDVVILSNVPAGTYYLYGTFNANCVQPVGADFQYALSFYTGANQTGIRLLYNETNLLPVANQNPINNFSTFGIVTIASTTNIYLNFQFHLSATPSPPTTWDISDANVGYIKIA